jgi:hypothetical protein
MPRDKRAEKMTTDAYVIRLVELFLQSPFYKKVPVSPGKLISSSVRNPPHEMICGPPDANGFVQWQPVDSPIDKQIVAGFERFLGIRLHQKFKYYLMLKCLFNMDLHFSVLPEIHPRHPLGWLEWSVMESRRPEVQTRPWYIPFTQARAGMGVLCLGFR